MKSILIIILLILLFSLVGFFVYDSIKKEPPDALIDLVTSRPEAPALPSGDQAPFIPPSGFSATVFARDVAGARVMLQDKKGTLLVSKTKEGIVVALPDLDQNGVADESKIILSNLQEPHGMALVCPDTGNTSADQDACILYVAETNAVKSYSYDADTYTARYQETLTELPFGDGHFTRTLLMHPDGKRLLVSVGSSCNVCNEEDERRATVLAINLETGETSTFARGLRNSVFLAVHPKTEEVWGSENGRDLIGDDIPPDEINIIKEGIHYGWPVCYGKNIYDTDFNGGENESCDAFNPSHIDLQAHSAALGLSFIKEDWGEEYQDDLLVALHGSWNRSVPTGYKVVRIPLNAEGKQEGDPVDFLTGFIPTNAQDGDEAIGRPVDILMLEGGTAFVSDDHAGAIYKITKI